MLEIFILMIFISAVAIGFVCGKYSERIAWNRLIERGVLPRPKNSNKNVDLDFYGGDNF